MLQTGQVLHDRYRVVAQLAQGGFGAVYKGWDISLNKHIAIKENLDTSPEAQRQFQHEAQILATLTHPNLPRVQDHFLLPGQGQYLIMDFIEGEDLQDMLIRLGQPLSEDYALAWITQVCEALAYLHTQNPPIIHRDIKPANIKITPQGKAVLVDFGISKIYDPKLKTTVGARAVTPGYSPVEQYGQGVTDTRSDIYALGATLYMLLTGQEPQESVQRTLEDTLKSANQINPQVMPTVAQVVHKAMIVSPSGRYQSVPELQTALADAARRAKNERLDLLLQQATAQLKQQDFVAAEANVRQALTIEPQHVAALALLNQIGQQRTIAPRYQALITAVSQAKSEAAALQQIDPHLADPAGVLRLLNGPVAASAPAAVPPSIVPAPPTARSRRLAIGASLLVIGSIGALLVGLALWSQVAPKIESSPFTHDLGAGNFLVGVGAGVLLVALVLLNLSARRSGWREALISVLVVAGAVVMTIGLSSASIAAFQVVRSSDSVSLGFGNFLLGLGVSAGLGGLVLLGYSRLP
jgi:serine/threonine protein kinase